MAEAVNNLYKTELIRQRGSWRTAEQVELATLEWVWWWNNSREPLLPTVSGFVGVFSTRARGATRRQRPRCDCRARDGRAKPPRSQCFHGICGGFQWR